MSDDNEFAFDLFDPKQTQHMWDLMAKMRQQCPVAHPAEGFSYTARYEDTERVFRDAKTFSCAGGFRAAGVDIPVDELFLAEMDPPLHPKLRKFLLRFFNPGMAAKAEVFTRGYVGGLFDQIAAKGGGNIVAELSTPVPVAVTGHVLGVPLEDIATLGDRLFELLHTDSPAYRLA